MLNVMRKHAGSWMIKVILFAIVIVFVFWGVGSFRSREASKVAVVDETIITLSDYRRAYNNLIDQYRQRFGARLNDGMIEMLQVKQQALNQLIDRTVLLQEAEALGLRVTDVEIADAIVSAPVFQSNGTFDSGRYRRVLAQVHLTPEEFEADQRQAMLAEKLTRIVLSAAKVSELESREWYNWQNTTVNVDYVLFEPAGHPDVVPSEEAISEYFDTNKERYQTDPMVAVRYVRFDPQTYNDQANVDESEIKEYYDTHPDEFRTEKTVEARHILIKVDAEADANTDQAAESKAASIAQMAAEGQDFAELAKTYSEGPTKDRGGYLGKFTREQMVKPFADKAFSMSAGEISEPVKTRFGWHVIKVESVEEATTRTLAQSRDSIAAKLKEIKARNMAYDNAERFFERTYEQNNLVDIAQASGLTVMEAGPFSRSGPEELGADKGAFASAAFELDVDAISDIQEIGASYFLIQKTRTIEATIPPLTDVKARVTADVTQQMQDDKAAAEAAAMAAEIQGGASFEASAAKRGVTVEQTGPFKRDAAIPQIGQDPAFAQAAFLLSPPGAISDAPVKGGNGYYLLRLAERTAPPADGFTAERERIEGMLLQQKQRNVLQDWLDARKAERRINIEQSVLE